MKMHFKDKVPTPAMEPNAVVAMFLVLIITMIALEYFGSTAEKNRKAEKQVIALQAENEMLRNENIRLLKHYEQSITALAKAGIKLE